MIAALGTVAAVLFIVLCLGVSVVLTRRRAREAETRLAALRSAGLEVSLGYTCVLEIAEGEVDGEPYDAVRRSIRVDHTWVEGGDILDGELRGALPRPSELEGHGPDGGHEYIEGRELRVARPGDVMMMDPSTSSSSWRRPPLLALALLALGLTGCEATEGVSSAALIIASIGLVLSSVSITMWWWAHVVTAEPVGYGVGAPHCPRCESSRSQRDPPTT